VSTPPSAAPGDCRSLAELERYLSHLRNERRLSAHTLSAYSRDARMLVALAAGRALDALGPQDIRRFVATLHGKGQSPRSLARILSSWRGLYAWLARRREVGANPCAGVRAPRAPKNLPQALSPDEAVRLLSVEADPESGDIHLVRGPHYRGIQFHAESILTEHGYDLLHDLVSDLLLS